MGKRNQYSQTMADNLESPTLKTPRTFHEIEMSPLRLRVEKHLQEMPQSFGFCGATTCDIEVFEQFAARCRRARVRPPSFYAYVSRCLGVVLEPQRELLAARYRNTLIIPHRVDVRLAAEVNAYDNSKTPYMITVEDLSHRNLPDLATEIYTRLREAKRIVVPNPIFVHRLAPSWSPRWWKKAMEAARERRHYDARRVATYKACVQLSSTSLWMQGRVGWGIQMFTPTAISITLGGMSRRAVVVGDEIVPRMCVDVAFHFDHLLVDGAPATRFIAQLSREIESGRLLGEYDLPNETATSSTRSSAKTSPSLLDKSDSKYRESDEESDENLNDAARYNESRA